MQPKEKVGDIVIPSNNMELLTDMVRRHYKNLNNEKKGKREMRNVQKIFKTTLNDPEYQARRQRKREEQSQRNAINFNNTSGMTSRT